MKLLFLIILFYTTLFANANAYLDPGSAGIFQMILAALAAAAASISIYWNKFLSFLKKLFKIKKKDNYQDKT